MDPFALLGVSPDATTEELTRAHRQLAKQFHPDRVPTSESAFRMAQINAAYDRARELVERRRREPRHGAPRRPGARTRRAGAWLEPAIRRALGGELLKVLHEDEPVRLVVPTSTWASPQARLAVTDRRLLWLLEDAISDRVRSLRFDDVAEVGHRLAWPRRRTATVRLRDALGRRLSFSDLAPETAAQVVGHVRA